MTTPMDTPAKRPAAVVPKLTDFQVYTRGDSTTLEPFEKPVVAPLADDLDPARHAWADARFATDIMAEHAVFFALLMPPEVAANERAEAENFADTFGALNLRVDEAGPPERGEIKRFTSEVVEAIKPFIDYKARLGEAQRSGSLRSLVWPLFFDHARHEAERWSRRLEQVGAGESEFDHGEVCEFWTNIMDEHARFVAHLLDPAEFELIETAMKASRVFAELTGGPWGSVKALVKEPGLVAKAIVKNPELDEVLSAAEEILDFKTKAARDIEAGRIMSIIDPRLADHVRREALKFVDELRRSS